MLIGDWKSLFDIVVEHFRLHFYRDGGFARASRVVKKVGCARRLDVDRCDLWCGLDGIVFRMRLSGSEHFGFLLIGQTPQDNITCIRNAANAVICADVVFTMATSSVAARSSL